MHKIQVKSAEGVFTVMQASEDLLAAWSFVGFSPTSYKGRVMRCEVGCSNSRKNYLETQQSGTK